MGIADAWRALWGTREEKASRTAPIMVQFGAGQPRATPRDYAGFSKEGYQQNIIVYRCIRLIAQSAAAVPWLLFKGDEEIETHPLLDLLAKPNPMQGGAQFFEALYAFYLIAGNAYIENVAAAAKPKELWTLRPDRMKVIPGQNGVPAAYRYTVGGKSVDFAVDALNGRSEVLHVKSFNPLDDWYGMSPLEAAAFSIDQHNEAGKWNAKLLANSGRPTGALVYTPPSDDAPDTLTEQQRAALRSEMETAISGAGNAGRPLILEGGLDWKEMAMSPKDMDWLQGKNLSAQEIALAYHVPSQLVGIEGSLTFANFEQARLALYDDAVLPLIDTVRDELNRWLVPLYGDGLRLDYDVDSIGALEPRRKEKWEAVKTADFLTINEKRAAVGYEEIDGGDMLLVSAGAIPLDTVKDVIESDADEADAAGRDAYGDAGGSDDSDEEQQG